MTDLNSMAFDGLVNRAVDEIVEPELERLRDLIAGWMEILVTQLLPVFSGYAASNVRLQLWNSKRKTQIRPNDPPLSAKIEFARDKYTRNIKDNFQVEVAKLKDLTVDDIIIFHLDVDYDNTNFDIALSFDVIETVAVLSLRQR